MEPNSVVGDRTKNHLQELLLELALTHLLTAHIDQQVITKGKVLERRSTGRAVPQSFHSSPGHTKVLQEVDFPRSGQPHLGWR